MRMQVSRMEKRSRSMEERALRRSRELSSKARRVSFLMGKL